MSEEEWKILDPQRAMDAYNRLLKLEDENTRLRERLSRMRQVQKNHDKMHKRLQRMENDMAALLKHMKGGI